MKLTVLIDNNTLIDRYYIGEPGVAYFIEVDGIKILFDTGYSDAFIKNAAKMKIDILDIDYIVLSHGHNDHTWGLEPFIRKYIEEGIENESKKPKALIAHPFVFDQKYDENRNIIGMNLSGKFIEDIFTLKLSKKPIWITDKLVFLGEIPRIFEFEGKEAIGIRRTKQLEEKDYLLDDSAVAYLSDSGLVIITGCSHSGICNITEYAKKVTGISKVSDIIGGFHLLNPECQQLEGTRDYLAALNLRGLYPCHCTDLHSKIELAKKNDIKEVGVGLQIDFDKTSNIEVML